eukprot:g2227.t1
MALQPLEDPTGPSFYDPWALLEEYGVPKAEVSLLRALDPSKFSVSPAFGKASRAILIENTQCDNITKKYFSRVVTTYATGHRGGDGDGDGPGSLINFLVCYGMASSGMGVPMTGMLFDTGEFFDGYMKCLNKDTAKALGQKVAEHQIVLLSNPLLKSPGCLAEIFMAWDSKIPMLVVAVEDDLDWGAAWPTLGWPLDAEMGWNELKFATNKAKIIKHLQSQNSYPRPGHIQRDWARNGGLEVINWVIQKIAFSGAKLLSGAPSSFELEEQHEKASLQAVAHSLVQTEKEERHQSLEDELRRISRTLALLPLEDPTGLSFYGICNDISSLAKAGGVDDVQSMSNEAKEIAMAKQLAALKELRPANKALLLEFFKAVPAKSKKKLRQVSSQAEVQQPGDFYITIDEKSDESILKKVTRPKVLNEYPQYEMQNIRDALRFKCVVSTVVDAFRLLALLVDETQWAERGVHAVKVDLKKLLQPKQFGWRFIGCDLKMPNGLLVECYIAFAPLMAVDRINHIYFERWRGKDVKNLSVDEQQNYQADAKESTKRYNQALCETLKDTSQNQFTALFDSFPPEKRNEAAKVYKDIIYGSDASFSRSEVSQEQKVLADEILKILTKLENKSFELLVNGQKYIEDDNLKEAQDCFLNAIDLLQSQNLPDSQDLASARLLLVYTRYKLGCKYLDNGEFHEAAIHLKAVLDDKDRPKKFGIDRLQKVQMFCIGALYEEGKELYKEDNLKKAKQCFEEAKKRSTKHQAPLPQELTDKLEDYILMCREEGWIEYGASTLGTAQQMFPSLLGKAPPGMAAFISGKRELNACRYRAALEFFEKAKVEKEKNTDVLWNVPEAVEHYIKVATLKLKKEGKTTVSVFSDTATHKALCALPSLSTTVCLSTATIGLPKSCIGQTKVVVLSREYPAGSQERAELVRLLRDDITRALDLLEKHPGVNININHHAPGSVIVYFQFMSYGSSPVEEVERIYDQQIGNTKSKIYEGTVTRDIDQERSQNMTLALNTSVTSEPCIYEVGDTITIAQIQEEKIECKVKSVLGQGATATVFEVTTNGKICALKVFKAAQGDSFEDLCEEASLMLSSNYKKRHPNVLGADFVWYEQHTSEMFFLLELADGGNLKAWMDDERLYAGTEAEQQTLLAIIFDKLARGLRHLHELGILHEDVKPDNVLMTKEGNPLLADLGSGN